MIPLQKPAASTSTNKAGIEWTNGTAIIARAVTISKMATVYLPHHLAIFSNAMPEMIEHSTRKPKIWVAAAALPT